MNQISAVIDRPKCLWMLVSFGVTAHALCAEIVVDHTTLDLPGDRDSGGMTELLILEDDLYALLTGRGVFELDAEFKQLRAYKFDQPYSYAVRFVYVDNELHVVGQMHKERLHWDVKDIHLLRFGESTPLKTWKCGSRCLHPMFVNFFDYDTPAMIWGDIRKRKQYVRVVQLGTEREWRFDSSGFNPYIRRIGLWDETQGLQDIFIDLIRIESRGLKAPERMRTKTIRVSDLNLLEEEPKHLNDYAGVPDSELIDNPPAGYQALKASSRPMPSSHFWADTKARNARIGIHGKDWSEEVHGDEENGHLWWKVKTQYGIKHTRKTWYPQTLNCQSASGEPFESYLILADGGICWRTCGMTVYELRPGGFWREVYHDPKYQFRFTINLERKNQIHFSSGANIVQLDRGVDFCVEDLDQFQSSLP